MYSNLISSLKRGYETLKVSARSTKTRKTSSKTGLISRRSLPENKPVNLETSDCSSTEVLPNASLDQISFEEFTGEELVVEKSFEESTEEESSEDNVWSDCSNSMNYQIAVSSHVSSDASQSSMDMFEKKFLDNSEFENWLKVVLALRFIRNLLTPYLNKVVAKMHRNGPQKGAPREKFSLQDVDDYVNRKFRTSRWMEVRKWLNYLKMLHVNAGSRSTPTTLHMHEMSNIQEWTVDEGAWEMAKVFMHKDLQRKEHLEAIKAKSGPDASAFDLTALLNLICNCSFLLNDFSSGSVTKIEKALLELKNPTENAQYKITEEKMNAQFESILELVQDKDIFRHVEEHYQPCITKVELKDILLKIKHAKFSFVPKEESLSIIMEDKAPVSSSGNFPKLNDTVQLLQTYLSHIFSDALEAIKKTGITEILRNDANGNGIVDCDDEAKTIQEMSDFVRQQNRELDRLRSCIEELQQSEKKSSSSSSSNETEETLEYVLASEPKLSLTCLFERNNTGESYHEAPSETVQDSSKSTEVDSSIASEKSTLEPKKRKASTCSERANDVPAKRKHS